MLPPLLYFRHCYAMPPPFSPVAMLPFRHVTTLLLRYALMPILFDARVAAD